MGRLTTDKKVNEMSMVELAHNCCYAKDRTARYRDYDTDIDAREIAKEVHLGNVAIYKIIAILELPHRKIISRKTSNKSLVYADNRVKLEKVKIYGKTYTDITQIFSPR